MVMAPLTKMCEMQENETSPHWDCWFVYKVPYDGSSSQVLHLTYKRTAA